MSGPVVLGVRFLLAVSLYLFLGWAFYSLWKDIKQQGVLLASRQVPPISLLIDNGETAPQARHYTQSDVVIGRDLTCECPLVDEAVSARHARLSYHHNQWWLEDLNSTNGTFLNKEKLILPTVIISEDEFTCGNTRFIVSHAGDNLTSPTKGISNA